MAKKSKVIQMPNPVEYIRTKARSLAIHSCFITRDWQDCGLADIIVTRRQANGNYTSAAYVVDLFCLGVKKSVYLFNMGEHEYKEKLGDIDPLVEFVEIEYKLAHNIIYSAIEFAGRYGFSPTGSFTRVTQYMLEENTVDIEHMEIKCGLKGKPFYFQGVHEDKAMADRILKQLDLKAGQGNYKFKLTEDDPDENDDLDEEEDYEEIFCGLNYDEAVQVFNEHEGNIDELDEDQACFFSDAVEVLFDSLVDEDSHAKYYMQFYDDLDIEIVMDKMPVQIFGLPNPSAPYVERLVAELGAVFAHPDANDNTVLGKLSELKLKFKDVPYIPFMELYLDEDRDSAQYQQKLRLCEQQFPEYPLIKITSLILRCKADPEIVVDMKLIPLHDFFSGRESLSLLEIQQYLVYALFLVISDSDCSRIAAFHHALADIGFPDETMETLDPILLTTKINRIYEMLI